MTTSPELAEWTDEEIATFTRRVEVLKKGIAEVDAERLAEEMLRRDRPGSGDDRRICLECTRFKKGKCLLGYAALPDVLQRCDRFAQKEAANAPDQA